MIWNFRFSDVRLLNPDVAGVEHQSQLRVMLESMCAKQGPVELHPSPCAPRFRIHSVATPLSWFLLVANG